MKADTVRPILQLLTDQVIGQVIEEAYTILATVGVQVENTEALTLLGDHGCRIVGDRAFIPADIIDRCRTTVPRSISLFDRQGALSGVLTGNNAYFDPGSAALKILEADGKTIRTPHTADVVNFARLVEQLDNFAFQSTALIPDDVPAEIADRYRLYLMLQYCQKPVVTGTFRTDAFDVMRRMLTVIRGTEQALRDKPLAIFDCCPSSPLKWSDLTVHDLIQAARAGIPAELVAMPLSGAAAPVTLIGTLVQHTAENLSGIVIHQLASPGAPIIYGGSPAIMDMSRGTTPMGAIETMMVETAYSRIGKSMEFPTHAYMVLSDTKTIDYQGGLESGMGAIMAVLGGVNVISGAGMLDFESCQSYEKLVLDHEIAGMALRLGRGIEIYPKPFAREFFEPGFDGNFLASAHTFELFEKEFYFPTAVIDRNTTQQWENTGRKNAAERAHDRVLELLRNEPRLLDREKRRELHDIMNAECTKFACELPK